MITLESIPPFVSLFGNPILFRLTSDVYVSQPGVFAVYHLQFSGCAAEWDTLSLSWGDESLLFTYKNLPDNSGLQLSSIAVEPDLLLWVELSAFELSMNTVLSSAFVVTVSGYVITLTARFTGPDYDLSHHSTGYFGVLCPSYESGVLEVILPFFKIHLITWLRVGEDWVKVSEDALPVDADGFATFDLHRVFGDYLSSDFLFPEATDQIVTARPEMSGEYRITAFESWGSPAQTSKMIQSVSFFFLNGAVTLTQQGKYNRENTTFWEKLCYNQYFLTWQPKTKYISGSQMEKLYYFVREEYESISLMIAVYYKDGTSLPAFEKVAVADPVIYTAYEFVLTLNILELPGWDEGTILYYEVYVNDHLGQRISEIRKYYLDEEYYQFSRYFLFRNSLGGFDTLRTTGLAATSMDYERTTVTRPVPTGYTDKTHGIQNVNTSEKKTFKANTGWLNEFQLDWVYDFLISPQLYQVVGSILIPVVVISNTVIQSKDASHLRAIEFDYSRSLVNECFTREIVGATFSIDFNDDYANL